MKTGARVRSARAACSPRRRLRLSAARTKGRENPRDLGREAATWFGSSGEIEERMGGAADRALRTNIHPYNPHKRRILYAKNLSCKQIHTCLLQVRDMFRRFDAARLLRRRTTVTGTVYDLLTYFVDCTFRSLEKHALFHWLII